MSGCTKTDKPVLQILLSTYNGEKYLREQLDSYISQKNFSMCSVLIRDDGSTDGTREILREYEQKDGFTVCYGENCGVNASYWWLLENSDSECEYFALSDQDDVWLPDKLEKSIAGIAKTQGDGDIPVLFASLSQIVDENLNPMGSTLHPNKGVGYYNAVVQNVLPGHTQVMNRSLRDVLLRHGAAEIHAVDWWFYLAAAAVGKICFAGEFTVRHRQHSGNCVGYNTSFLKKTRQRFRNLKSQKANAISVQLADFFLRYEADMPDEYRAETRRYFAAMSSCFKRIGYALTCKVYRQSSLDSALFRVLYVLGKYNYCMERCGTE